MSEDRVEDVNRVLARYHAALTRIADGDDNNDVEVAVGTMLKRHLTERGILS